MEIVPPLLKDITKHICILCDNKVKPEAIYNMFLSRFASSIATKDILTDSVKHIRPVPLAYYGLNFASSGGGKNTPFMALKDLFGWLDNEYEQLNKKIYEQYIINAKSRLTPEKAGNAKELKEIELEAKRLTKIKTSLNGCTSQKMYLIAEQIAKSGFGSLFFYDTEFLKKYKEKQSKGNYDKTLDIIYNLYDGEVDFTDTVMTDRNELKNISCSACFSSDSSMLKSNNKLRNDFKQYLLDGFARRVYICYDDELYKRQEHLSVNEIMQEKKCKQYFANELQLIYENVREKTLYVFSDEANELIRDYIISIDKEIDEKYTTSDVLAIEDEILKVDLEGSAWKIVKTAFLFHLLLEPKNDKLRKETLQMAISYYRHFRKYLTKFLEIKDRDELENIKSYIKRNLDKEMTFNTQFRKLLKIEYKNWKSYKLCNLQDLYDALDEDNITYVERKEGKTEYIKFYKKG